MAGPPLHAFLDFEAPIAEIEGRIAELRHRADTDGADIGDGVARLVARRDRLLAQIYGRLVPSQTVQVARHPDRPRTRDYLDRLVDDAVPLAGDRVATEDPGLIGVLGRFRGHSVVALGHQRSGGRGGHGRAATSAGGYRKAARLMRLADRFRLPVIGFVDTGPDDTPLGGLVDVGGRSAAIATAIDAAFAVRVPMLAVIVGEGAGAGALALAAADRVLMLEHAVYWTSAPEHVARALWRDPEQARAAAGALRPTAKDLSGLGVIDAIVKEPVGGAHRDPVAAIDAVGEALAAAFAELVVTDGGILRSRRRERFLRLGSAEGG